MRGVVFLGGRKLELREFPDPTPGPGEVVVAEAEVAQHLELFLGRQPQRELGHGDIAGDLDRLRQRKRLVFLDSEEGENNLKLPASEAPSPLDISERKETSACVQRCLDFLPDKYRAVILLHEAHSLTAPEIADLLGVTLATVKIRLHRARHGLQQVMKRGCAVSNDKLGTPTCHPKS